MTHINCLSYRHNHEINVNMNSRCVYVGSEIDIWILFYVFLTAKCETIENKILGPSILAAAECNIQKLYPLIYLNNHILIV